MAKGVPKPDVKASVTALVKGAAAGRPDLAWLDRAIREAGYVPKGERATKAEVEEALKAVVRVLEDVALDCAGTCGEHWLDRAAKGIDRLRGASARGEGVGTAESAENAEKAKGQGESGQGGGT